MARWLVNCIMYMRTVIYYCSGVCVCAVVGVCVQCAMCMLVCSGWYGSHMVAAAAAPGGFAIARESSGRQNSGANLVLHYEWSCEKEEFKAGRVGQKCRLFRI